MTNDSIKRCVHPGWSNPLTPSIQSELQGLFSWISKAAHAFFNHPLGLKIPCLPCGGLHPLTSLAAAVMALALLPAAPAVATEATLYVFPESGQTGYYPTGTLCRDANGVLYGTTFLGGAYNQGNVFKLTPPAPGRTNWAISVLYDFHGGNDGGAPFGGVVMDANGTLNGTAYAGGVNNEGVVFKLTPPGP
jgi:uncharacterized repeat protein (TIGR03803 family)